MANYKAGDGGQRVSRALGVIWSWWVLVCKWDFGLSVEVPSTGAIPTNTRTHSLTEYHL